MGEASESKPNEASDVPTWHDGIERISKTAIAVLGGLFAVGMIIENVQLQTIGIHEVSMAQPRFVLVGLAFFVYLAIPAILIALPVLVYRETSRHAGKYVRISAMLAGGITLVFLFYVLPIPFVYFVPRLVWVDSSYTRNRFFWSYFVDPTLILRVLLLYLPALLATAQSEGGFWSWKRRKRLYSVLISLGVFSSVMPYVQTAYLNLSRSVGGGAPLVAEIDLRDGRSVRPSTYMTFRSFPKFEGSEPATQPFEQDALGKYVVMPLLKVGAPSTQPSAETLLIWHESDKFIYASKLAYWGPGSIIVAAPKDQIAEMRFRPGVMDFRNGGILRAYIPWDFSEVDASLMETNVRLKTLIERRAATQPSIMTPEMTDALDRINKLIESRK